MKHELYNKLINAFNEFHYNNPKSLMADSITEVVLVLLNIIDSAKPEFREKTYQAIIQGLELGYELTKDES